MNDPSDLLSPILVKELRQGLRARVFTITFLALQGLIIMSMVFGLLMSSGQGGQDEFNGFFWTMVSIPILLAMPISGLGAIHNEQKQKTLDLMFLTRLSAFRIVAGKWSSITAQTLLLTTSVLPYVVMRYFLGGIELWQDLLGLGMLVLASVVLTAFTVGFSALGSRMPKWLVVVGGFLFVQALFSLPMFAFRSSFGGSFRGDAAMWVRSAAFTLGFTTILVLTALQAGAGRIAPPAENHSTRIRLLALAALALAVLCSIGATEAVRNGWAGFVIVLLAPIAVFSICESIRRVPSLYVPFVRRGPGGRLAGVFLYPGWPSGVPFALGSLVLFCALLVPADDLFDNILTVISAFGALCLPMAILRLFLPRTRRVFSFYLLLQMAFAVPAYIYAVSQASSHSAAQEFVEAVLGFFPTSVFLVGLFGDLDNLRSIGAVEAIAVVVSAAGVIALLVACRRAWTVIRELEKRAGVEPRPAHPAAPTATEPGEPA